ncbi:16S rRNA (guanine(527)-N(7))-methyltransferase RsmG [candidate division KSB3 bacterium]|uniref:Ribosomal RNA small subunit methyltransferase G n=1 Tax=candidate division KSB3 bacterium TaxID=2044937 RepID=A0A2G6E2R5_9BACT|nr:MAG: 16S rRNA (guanine(527)-N(7))-methyltransferase RsmG [candidate division KSB3 bacterium]PIE29257.1 MAG: 16S rRNA (guanine(527)-N(7))-methyltransferase RsmG [candidate division KSB3 bacterium]
MSGFEEFRVLLRQELAALNLTLHADQEQQFFVYFQELRKWNQKINLSGNDDEVFVVQQHFIDSLSCTLTSVPFERAHLLDIGTGAGFPGLPLKIYFPDMHVTLVDAVSKKIIFLRHLCRQLGLFGVTCLAARLPAQKTSDFPTSGFDVIVSRAVGSLRDVLIAAVPLLASDGSILLQRGKKGLQEIEENQLFLQEQSLQVAERRELRLPFLSAPRYLFTFHVL